MNRAIGVFAAAPLLLVGCVQYIPLPGTESSDADTRATAPMLFTSPRTPSAAARCIIRNIDDRYFTMTTKLEEFTDPSSLEVRARSEVGIAAIIGINARSASGSEITVRISNHYLQKERMAQGIVEGC